MTTQSPPPAIEAGKLAIRDCYPCFGTGVVTSQLQFRFVCWNCGGSGISPTWAMSDGSDASKRKAT